MVPARADGECLAAVRRSGVFSASYFDRDFRYEADATDYEFRFNQNCSTSCNTCYDDCGRLRQPPSYDFGGDPRGFATNHEETEITTFEARLQSPCDSKSRWSWLIGAFYSEEKGKTAFDSYVRGYPNTPSFAYFSYYEANSDRQSARADRDVVPRPLRHRARPGRGVRRAQFRHHGRSSRSRPAGAGSTTTASSRSIQEAAGRLHGATLLDGNQKTSEDGTVGKLNLTYRFDKDRLVYATYSEGFRVGGSNPLKPASLLPRDYDSDKLTNYEIGAKTEWLDNRVRFNIAAYYMEWDKFAVQVEDPQPNVFQLGFVNLPTAEIPGVEADFAVTLERRMAARRRVLLE